MELGKSRRESGVVSLEFLFIFPVIVGLIYGAAGYGVLFFNKYQMQVAVDRATSSVFSLDRRQSTAFAQDALNYSSSVLEALSGELPALAASRIAESSCSTRSASGLELLEWTLVADGEESSFLPQLNFGFLGAFPPLPQNLTARSTIAF
ncbi:TadE/TadG family type IV pilus assembly protein [Marinobacter adhaerens]|uniref:TadE/TadG family type IV pilus assembly protein n=1 Tax=Marinobacter adhaerens TaxID=1033846 RepID=UPI00215149B0|nr:TadE/TadG family type IV pilus assembly protein [Marinobacter adhaerens]